MRRISLPGALLVLAACRGTLSPLSNRVQVGQEAYVVVVADGEDGSGDLFASSTGGGTAWQITFTRVDERLPALSPDGISLAFVRSRAPDDTAAVHISVMNLLNGAERQVELSAGTRADQLAWSPDGSRIYLRSESQVLVSPAPPAPIAFAPVSAPGRLVADSAFVVLLGTPPTVAAESCVGGAGLCVRLGDGSVVPLAAGGSGPLRWSGDSVAYWDGGVCVVRPMSGGRTRAVTWDPPLAHPRQATMYPGSGVRDGPS